MVAVERVKVSRRDGHFGAYGLRLTNVRRAQPFLVPAGSDWPTLEIRRRLGRSPGGHEWISDRAARMKLRDGGEITVDRARGRATFLLPRRLSTVELVHPLLAPAAATMSWWLGRQAFHASAFVAGGRAWAVVGARGSGKSTTIARLALDGIPIVSDDLVVIDAGQMFAGPRSVDLRRESAQRLQVGEPLGVVGTRARWRLAVDPVPSAIPFGGWLFLSWGDRVESETVSAAQRLRRLHENRSVLAPPLNPDGMFDAAELPGWELRRPHGWKSLSDTVDCLLQTVS